MEQTYTFDGLAQHSLYNYNFENSRRRVEKKNFTFTRQLNLFLPLFLTVPLWRRHGYSLGDIRTTLEFFSSVHLWQCALLYGISPSNSAIKLAFATPESMVYGSKAIVIRKIEKMLEKSYNFAESGTVLDTVRDDHVPPLPIHKLPTKRYQTLYRLLPQQPVDMLKTIYIESLFVWNDIQVVPLWLEKNALYCVRIVLYDIFEKCGRIKKKCLSNRPLEIIVGEKVRYAGVEEAMFFMCV